MSCEEVVLAIPRGIAEKANHDFHLRLTLSEKERLVKLSQAAGYATMSQFLKDQIFKQDIHHKLDLILKKLGKGKSEK